MLPLSTLWLFLVTFFREIFPITFSLDSSHVILSLQQKIIHIPKNEKIRLKQVLWNSYFPQIFLFTHVFCLYKDSVFVDIEHHRCSFEFLSVIVQYSLPYRKEHNCLGFFSLFIRTFSDLLIISSLSEKHFCLLIWTFRCHTLHHLLQHYSHR